MRPETWENKEAPSEQAQDAQRLGNFWHSEEHRPRRDKPGGSVEDPECAEMKAPESKRPSDPMIARWPDGSEAELLDDCYRDHVAEENLRATLSQPRTPWTGGSCRRIHLLRTGTQTRQLRQCTTSSSGLPSPAPTTGTVTFEVMGGEGCRIQQN